MSQQEQVVRLSAEGIELGVKLQAGERLGTVLERQREEMGLTTEELAADLPIREWAYYRIEAGYNCRPPDDILEAIATALSLDIDDLKDLREKDIDEPVDPDYYYYWY